MSNLKSYLILGLCMAQSAVFAQQTVPYASTIGDYNKSRISSDWTVINANDDAKKWQYSDNDLIQRFTGFNCGAIYERSLESPKQADDWVVSPAISLEEGKKYKLSWYSFTYGFKEDYELVMAQSSNIKDLTGDDAKNLIKIEDYMNYSSADQTIIVLSAEKSGEYNFGFHVYSSAEAYRLYLTGFEIQDFILTPAAVADLTAENEEEKLEVNLSWTLPTKDDTGAELAASDITAIKIYRDGELIATLDGNATSYTDTSMTRSGFYTYEVAAVAEGEGKTASVKTSYVGPMEALSLPYVADFTSAESVALYWTLLDANNDGITWKYYNSYGTQMIVYSNMSTSTIEDDWAITPAIHFPSAGTYKVTWNGYAYKGNMDFWLGGDKTVDQMLIHFGTLDRDDLASFSRSDHVLEVRVPDEGDYYIGVHNNQSPSLGIDYYMYGFKVEATEDTAVKDLFQDNKANNANDAIYDLFGRKIANPAAGTIYIQNGKKFIAK